MASNQSLPVLVPQIPGQSWSCHSCGDCCRSLVGDLTEQERKRIDDQGWANRLDVAPYVRVGKGWALNKRADNVCVFLDEENRCRIHSEFGEQAKPFACRIFPFSVRAVKGAWQASLRFDCPSVISSRGEPVRGNRLWLQFLLKELDHQEPQKSDSVNLQRGIRATDFERDRINQEYLRWFKNEAVPFRLRLLGAAHVTTTLANAGFKKVRGERLAELLNILFQALPNECNANPPDADPRQQGMLRQLAFAHVEHVTLAQRQARYLSRLNMRRNQLQRSRRFRKGIGEVPSIADVTGEVCFEDVEAVSPEQDAQEETQNLLLRYITGRFESGSVFGAGYYDWPVFNGLTALCCSVAVVGWLARYIAAADGCSTMSLHHIGWALGTMDRGATRFPALGTMAERMRVSYFHLEDGLARIMNHYSLLSEADDQHAQ